MPLFRALAATWPPAEILRLGPWTLRRCADAGDRVSAATLDARLDGPLAELDAAEAAMRAWGQRPKVMIRPGEAALDEDLAARGYAIGSPSLVLAAPAAALAFAATPEEAMDCDGPLACMAALWAAGGIGPARLAVMARAPAPKTWLLGRLGDCPSACAFVALDGATAMLHALEVSAAARRQGVGALLVRAAATWAQRRGATTLALAVSEANAPARALYAGLGFAEAARYHYRLAPEERR